MSNFLNLLLSGGLSKHAFDPMPGGQQMPPQGQDPSQGGQMPPQGMDPSQMQGQPMDPSQMQGGMPPQGMDPSQMGGMPPQGMDPSQMQGMDPSQMGGQMPPQEPSIAELSLTDFRNLLREVVSDVLINGGKIDAETGDKKDSNSEIKEMLSQLMMMLTGGQPAPDQGGQPQGDPSAQGGQQAQQVPAMGAGAGQPMPPPQGMEQQASARRGNIMSLADLIIDRTTRAR